MADVRPFRVVRPRDTDAEAVIAPPYDVLSEAQARSIARERRSFVRITRSEVDLPEGTDPHSEAAYAKARETLDAFLADGLLEQDDAPSYLFYGQIMGDHEQVGIIAACSVDEYDDGRIAKHEFTRPDKEDDRTHHMEVLDAQVGLVFLAYRPTDALARITAEVTASAPRWRVTTDDGVVHTVWSPTPAQVEAVQAAFADVDKLYVADGHHRSAAASRVHAHRKSALTSHFIAGLYPSDRLQVMAYNRVVHDLNGHTPDAFLAAVGEAFTVSPANDGVPAERGEVRMYIGGTWRSLRVRDGRVDLDDPVARLDASVLQQHLLGPLLGIDDPRRSTRITFVGGIHGPDALVEAVDAGAAVAFHLYPTGLDQLFEVADAGEVMPPKSTWFEPKLRGGVVVHRLD
ncbi:MAG: DUF1015 domain-containing protein [Myxococcales bacterium]|nr:DUF1015 domain-containing protein [Myxococcales bacterium]